MPTQATNDEEFVVVDDRRVPSSASWSGAAKLWLLPISRLQVKDDEIREVGPVLILPTEYQDLFTLPESGRMSHTHAGYIAVVVDQVPLSCFQVEAEDMVVDLVRVLIEAAERIDLRVADVCYYGTEESAAP